MKFIYDFFDRLEDKIRGKLSHYPILYAFIGSIGLIVFWRGIWHTADYIMETIFYYQLQDSTINLGVMPWWDGPLSILIGGVLLLATGLFVSNFIGNEVIISGLRGEKRLSEKTEVEVKTETGTIGEIKREVTEISRHLSNLQKDLDKND